jgi:hypothetical protein
MAHRAVSVNDLQRRFFTSRIHALRRKQLPMGEKMPRKLLRGPILRQPVRPEAYCVANASRVRQVHPVAR